MGVRSSWLIWLRKASFCTESCVSFSFASRSWRAIRVSSSDCASSRAEYSMICAVSLATAIRSSTDTASPPTAWLSIACAVAAPTEPDSRRSSASMNSGVGSGKAARQALRPRLGLEEGQRLVLAQDALRQHQQILGPDRAVHPARARCRPPRRR